MIPQIYLPQPGMPGMGPSSTEEEQFAIPPPGPGMLGSASMGVPEADQNAAIAQIREKIKVALEERLKAIKAQQDANAKPVERKSGAPSLGQVGLTAAASLLAHALGDKKGEFAKAAVPALLRGTEAHAQADFQNQEAARQQMVQNAQLAEEAAMVQIESLGRELALLQGQQMKGEDRKIREQALIERTLDKDVPVNLIRASLSAQGVKISPEVDKYLNALGVQQDAKAKATLDEKERTRVRLEIQNSLSIWEKSTDPKVRQAAAAQFARAINKYPDEIPPGLEAMLPNIISDAGLPTPDQLNKEQDTKTKQAQQGRIESDINLNLQKMGTEEAKRKEIIARTKWIEPQARAKVAASLALAHQRRTAADKPAGGPSASEQRLSDSEERRLIMGSIDQLRKRNKDLEDPLIPGVVKDKSNEQEYKANDLAIKDLTESIRGRAFEAAKPPPPSDPQKIMRMIANSADKKRGNAAIRAIRAGADATEVWKRFSGGG